MLGGSGEEERRGKSARALHYQTPADTKAHQTSAPPAPTAPRDQRPGGQDVCQDEPASVQIVVEAGKPPELARPILPGVDYDKKKASFTPKQDHL